MNDFSDLETELKQLRPRPASTELTARVEAALAREASSTPTAGVLPRPNKFRLNWFSVAIGAAAAAAVVALARVSIDPVPGTQQPFVASSGASASPAMTAPATQASSFVPDGLTRVVYHTRDEGLVFPARATTPVRRVRSRARETLQWKEPSTGASLRVSYPTEEVELIPVSGQ